MTPEELSRHTIGDELIWKSGIGENALNARVRMLGRVEHKHGGFRIKAKILKIPSKGRKRKEKEGQEIFPWANELFEV